MKAQRSPETAGSAPVVTQAGDSAEARAIRHYLAGDRVPFSDGYTEYKEDLILKTMNDKDLVAAFASGASLPNGFGAGLDERIVEYPWVFSRLSNRGGLIIDAGSTFNKASLLRSRYLAGRRILVYTMETDWITYDTRLSYLFGDLRNMIVKDGIAETVVCISTLEHVGFTYEYKTYSRKNPWPHPEPDSHLDAVREFRRVLGPGGRLLLTFPYGRYEDHGWLQQFDAPRVDAVKAAFAGKVFAENYYQYVDGGWRRATAAECSQVSYFNIHEAGSFDADGAAAARAICCLELEK